MQREKYYISFIFVIVFLLFSCGLNKEAMQQGIMNKQQETFDNDPFYKDFGIVIQDVTLLKTGTNSYDGLMSVLIKNDKHNIPFTVKTDSNTYIWKIEADDLIFLLRYR